MAPSPLTLHAAPGAGFEAPFEMLAACHERVARAFQDRRGWARMVVRNVAKMGYFSSDRSVREYAERVWNVSPVPIVPPTP